MIYIYRNKPRKGFFIGFNLSKGVDDQISIRIIIIKLIRGDLQMFLPEYNSTAMQRNAPKIFEAATKGPIIINRMAKEGMVMLTKTEYAKLVMNQK